MSEIVARVHYVHTMSRRAEGTEPHPPMPTAKPGQLLTMDDGSQWFHAYDGSQPIQLKAPDRTAALIAWGQRNAAAIAEALEEVERRDREGGGPL
jgi:hypothetical protein